MDKVDVQKVWFLENPKGRLMDKFAKNNLPLFYDIIQQYPGDKFVEKLTINCKKEFDKESWDGI